MKERILLVLFISLIGQSHTRLTCKDAEKAVVDWFAVYKFPVKYDSNKIWPFPPHLYADSTTDSFTEYKYSLNTSQNALSQTLEQAYSNHKSSDVGYIFYNDEKPLGAGGHTSFYKGHTKGVAVFDQSSGFWLVHSVPKFPPPTNLTYSYPENGVHYGQHFLCISLSGPEDINKLGLQLAHNEPFIYDWNLPGGLKAAYPVMVDVISGRQPTTSTSVLKLMSVSQRQFISFAKTRNFNDDLYAGLVVDALQCDLAVETWQHGSRDNLPSNCTRAYKVKNIKQIAGSNFNVNFKNYEDHSKFAVCNSSSSNDVYWFCIGDINRQYSQFKRAGGTVCTNDKSMSMQYQSLIASAEDCKSSK